MWNLVCQREEITLRLLGILKYHYTLPNLVISSIVFRNYSSFIQKLQKLNTGLLGESYYMYIYTIIYIYIHTIALNPNTSSYVYVYIYIHNCCETLKNFGTYMYIYIYIHTRMLELSHNKKKC